MRPVREIPDEFFNLSRELGESCPLVEAFVSELDGHKPLNGNRLLLIQHQLSNQVAMVDALIRLGANPKDVYWLDIPYTSNEEVRDYVESNLHIGSSNLRVCDDYRVLQPYALYQYERTVKFVLELADDASKPLVVLDDGAYVLKALSALASDRWPRPISLIEQTTRGIIKTENSAAMQATVRSIPLVDVARSAPKRTLEPPFIAMAVCASLERAIRPYLKGRRLNSALVLGYGSIGEQVATYLTSQFELNKANTFIHDTSDKRSDLAQRRGFKHWDRSIFDQRFDLVIGCSGRASFELGDREYLNDGALLASASSGAVELSRKEFVELADASDLDDVRIKRDVLNENDLHSDIDIQLVDRAVTFVNAGFPVNFDGEVNTIPIKFIQQTAVLMAAAAVQAADAIDKQKTNILELDEQYCRWIDYNFREILGKDAHLLIPPPEDAW